MTPLELERLGKKMYGPTRWRSQLALNLGFDTATVHRWGKRDKIAFVVEVAVRGLFEQHKANVEAEKRIQEQLRKQGKLRPKLKTRKRKNDRLPAPVGDAADGPGADIPAGDRVDS